MSKIALDLNLKPVPRTNVIEKYFGDETKIDEINKNTERIYSCRKKVNGKCYIIKGETIKLQLNDSQKKQPSENITRKEYIDPLISLDRITRDFHLRQFLCKTNKHLVKPLNYDITYEVVNITEIKNNSPRYYIHTEVLYEDYGKFLKELYISDFTTLYTCLRQLCLGLLLLKSQGRHTIDINTTNIFYNESEKKLNLFDMGEDVKEVNDVKKVNLVYVATDFAPPEYLKRIDEIVSGNKSPKAGKSDVYCIAMMLYIAILNSPLNNSFSKRQEKDILKKELGLVSRRIGLREEYDNFVKEVIEEFEKIQGEKDIKRFVINKLRKALDYNPDKRPSLAELFWRMRCFEKKRDLEISHKETEEEMRAIERIPLDDTMTLSEVADEKKNIEELLDKDICECQSKDHYRIEFECGHKLCITSLMMKNFLWNKPYKQQIRCLKCKEARKYNKEEIKELLLSCQWFPAIEEMKTYDNSDKVDYSKCKRGDKLKLIDRCLIDDCSALKELILDILPQPNRKENLGEIELSISLLKDIDKRDLGDIGMIALKKAFSPPEKFKDLTSLSLSILMLKI